MFHQEAFLSVYAAEVARFLYRLAGGMVLINVMTPKGACEPYLRLLRKLADDGI
jgi:hypothetical protein